MNLKQKISAFARRYRVLIILFLLIAIIATIVFVFTRQNQPPTITAVPKEDNSDQNSGGESNTPGSASNSADNGSGGSAAGIPGSTPTDSKTAKIIDLPIFLDSKNFFVNAIETDLHFNPREIQIISISKEGSLIQYWVTGRPSFDNSKGEISIAGGIPTPGISGNNFVATLKLKKLVQGEVQITFGPKTRALEDNDSGTAIPLQLSALKL